MTMGYLLTTGFGREELVLVEQTFSLENTDFIPAIPAHHSHDPFGSVSDDYVVGKSRRLKITSPAMPQMRPTMTGTAGYQPVMSCAASA